MVFQTQPNPNGEDRDWQRIAGGACFLVALGLSTLFHFWEKLESLPSRSADQDLCREYEITQQALHRGQDLPSDCLWIAAGEGQTQIVKMTGGKHPCSP